MRDAGACRVKIDVVLARELLDVRVLLQILWRNILNVVVDGEHRLRRIGDRRRADLLELWDHRTGVVMRHDMARTNRNEIATTDHRAGSESISVALSDFFEWREAHIISAASISF